MGSIIDPWDELQKAVGRGWPHYKDIACPLISESFQFREQELLREQVLPKVSTKFCKCNQGVYLVLAVAIMQRMLRHF